VALKEAHEALSAANALVTERDDEAAALRVELRRLGERLDAAEAAVEAAEGAQAAAEAGAAEALETAETLSTELERLKEDSDIRGARSRGAGAGLRKHDADAHHTAYRAIANLL
jgi:chromosome segregation ATPase